MGVTTKTVIKAPNLSRPDGLFPIYIRITIDRNPRLVGLKKHVSTEYWDKEQSVVKKGAGNAQKLNFYISREKAKIDQIILDLQNEDKEVTFASCS